MSDFARPERSYYGNCNRSTGAFAGYSLRPELGRHTQVGHGRARSRTTFARRRRYEVIMKSKKKPKKQKLAVCTVCGDPATTTVDGEPSCNKHVALVYENQVEDYTRDEQANNAWVKP